MHSSRKRAQGRFFAALSLQVGAATSCGMGHAVRQSPAPYGRQLLVSPVTSRAALNAAAIELDCPDVDEVRVEDFGRGIEAIGCGRLMLFEKGPKGEWQRAGAARQLGQDESPLRREWMHVGGAANEAYRPPRITGGDEPYLTSADIRQLTTLAPETVVRCIIHKDGSALHCFIFSDDPVAAAAVGRVMESWRFEPAHLEGVPVTTSYTLSVGFSLEAINCQGQSTHLQRHRCQAVLNKLRAQQ